MTVMVEKKMVQVLKGAHIIEPCDSLHYEWSCTIVGDGMWGSGLTGYGRSAKRALEDFEAQVWQRKEEHNAALNRADWQRLLGWFRSKLARRA